MKNKFSEKPKRRYFKSSVNITWMLPNMLTLSALLSGLSAIRFAFLERWEFAVLMVALAGIFDALDGRMARLLKATSGFGEQLDSLSDIVVFGVVPAILLYLFVLNEGGRIAWASCLFYVACCALRLARFNSEIHLKPKWAENYFTGIPSPAAAFLVLMPLVIEFKHDWSFNTDWRFVALWIVLIGIGAISPFPTFAGKGFSFPTKMVLPIFAIYALIIVGLIARPWEAWLMLGVVYIILIPFSILKFNKLKKNAHSEN